jgi:hypothetical protein
MKKTAPDSGQAMHRVRVGMTGLASVLVLIGLASAVFSSAREEPASNVAAAPAVANLALGNEASTNEPLAEIGVAPTVGNGN